VGPLQSKSEKPHLQTFASQGQSEALVSSRQRAKVYAANRQCRTRKVGDTDNIIKVMWSVVTIHENTVFECTA